MSQRRQASEPTAETTFIGQTIDAGKNIEIKADNFFAGASMDTYHNKSKSSSTGF
ncbi:hypothetical protein [Fusobacterium sp. PH5-44]|uniref:hypothetical protein n=1 Tax=Fusobacterium sp. PH5-44 TaxID=2940518 RepID=UPI003D1AC7C7